MGYPLQLKRFTEADGIVWPGNFVKYTFHKLGGCSVSRWLFIYFLFYDAVGFSDYTVDGRLTDECDSRQQVSSQGPAHKVIWHLLRRAMKTRENFSQSGWCRGREPNLAPPKYKSEALPLGQLSMTEVLCLEFNDTSQHRFICSTVTQWSRVLLEKPPVAKLLKNFPTFYRNRRFIAVFTKAYHWSINWARLIQSTPPHPVSLIR
jgi:hypothetical protein